MKSRALIFLVAGLMGCSAPAEKAAIYPTDGSGLARTQAAIDAAKRDDKRVLLMTGGNWCGWCHKLHALFDSHKEIQDVLHASYNLVMIDTEADKAVIEKWKIQPEGVPYLTVLDGEGKKLTDQDTGSLEEGEHHDPAKVLAFLTKWGNAPKDAEAIFKGAMEEAAKADKEVFVVFGGEWCGWCRKLEAFLGEAPIKALFEKAFVIAHIDVDKAKGAEALLKEFVGTKEGGVPIFAFVDTKRKVLARANGGGDNIGYPAAPGEIAYFKLMLGQAQSKLSPGEINMIVARLDAIGKELNR